MQLIDGFVRDVAMKAGFGGALDAAPSAAALSTASLAAALPEAASHSATAGMCTAFDVYPNTQQLWR
ncbi:hypothetical protein EON67_10900 [archaeon]|nr:MAG: hypothetical protein EON67_10900 [archaeon]